jgi:ParB family chromosome partitioning protein
MLGLDSDEGIERVARQTVSRGLSVRQVESLVRRERTRAETATGASPVRQSPAARDLTARLQRALGARVRLVEAGQGRGYIEIHFHSLDELDTVLAKILPPS